MYGMSLILQCQLILSVSMDEWWLVVSEMSEDPPQSRNHVIALWEVL